MPFPGYASYSHPDNGMAWADMEAIQRVANRRNEVISFRSTGPWAKRWIENHYPTKGFHVKGKSSDWGPMAGLVPWDGRYSKVGHDAEKVKKGNKYNMDGVVSGHAKRVNLVLTMAEMQMQLTRPEEHPSRTALTAMQAIPDSQDYFLFARRPGDGKQFAFRAVRAAADAWRIWCFSDTTTTVPAKLIYETGTPLDVMTTMEVGTDKPMTGDYDLWAICPSWKSYGSGLGSTITIPGVKLKSGKVGQSQTFHAGQGLDNVLDSRLHAGGWMGAQAPKHFDYHHRKDQYLKKLASLPPNSHQHKVLVGQLQALGILDAGGGQKKETPFLEHQDMGNLTPRIMECIMTLNNEMGAANMGVLRRVHHNAESHRYRMFGAITAQEAQAGEGLPITIFQPSLMGKASAIAATGYETIDTIVNWGEFQTYALRLAGAGYFVPRNWVWGG